MKIKDLALLIKGTVEGNGNAEVLGVSGMANAKNDDLTFAINEDRLAMAEGSQAVCILVPQASRQSTKNLIRVKNPKLAFLMSYSVLYPPQPGKSFTHPTASVSPSVKLGKDVYIDSYVSIGDNVVIEDGTIIESGCIIKKDCSIGKSCHLYPRVVLYENTVLKDKVTLHAGIVIGSDGFGYVKDKDSIYKFPQLGKVIIEENVEIGANCTIDRGSLDDTVIGANSKIDNLCHIAHNVKIGRNVLMAAQTGIAGSTVIGDNVSISGQVAVTDNVTVGNNSFIGGKSCVIGNIDENAVVWGIPARPLTMAKRQIAVLIWLTKNFSLLSKIVKETAKQKRGSNFHEVSK